MRTKKISLALLLIFFIITTVSIFYQTKRFDLTAINVYGDSVELFGIGIYAYESLFKGPVFLGTDIIIFLFVLPLFIYIEFIKPSNTLKTQLISLGLMTCLLYYSASLAFGVTMNRLFIFYITAFGLSFYTFVFKFKTLNTQIIQKHLSSKTIPKSLLVFMIILGLSTFVWFFEIIEAFISNRPSEIIGMQVTEPTFVMDLAILLPTCFFSAYFLKKKHYLGVILSTLMLILIGVVGLMVVSQTLTQLYYGVQMSSFEFIMYVLPFVLLSLTSLLFLKKNLSLINP